MSQSLLRTLLAGVLAILSSGAAAGELTLAPEQGVLLLTNGEVIAGTITPAGDRYDVDVKDGQICIRRSDVAIVCADVNACYLHKRAGIEQGRVQDHLELAEWCLRNDLVAAAETELNAARAADPKHPKIRLLEPRLAIAKESPKGREPASTVEKSAPVEVLDGMVRNLPTGSMESFTNTIQPLLLNYCGKSGCHGPRSTNALRLERIAPNRQAGRHPTQRNLQAALALVDRTKPDDSKLLLATIRPHGTLKVPVFTDREQSQYKQLVQWVYLLANSKESGPRPSLGERGAPLLQAVPGRVGQPMAAAPTSQRPAPSKQPSTVGQDWSSSFPDQARGAGGTPAGTPDDSRVARAGSQGELPPAAKRPGETADTYIPKDPFDPEIFNRRYLDK
jgi:hypothetical protein